MSQDRVSDGLNQMMNAVRARKNSVTLKHHSKLLLSILAIAKLKGYVKSYKVENNMLKVEIDKLNKCNSIKPRFIVQTEDIDKYIKRYLPAKNLGIIIVTNTRDFKRHTRYFRYPWSIFFYFLFYYAQIFFFISRRNINEFFCNFC